MISSDDAKRLHDKSTRGELLTVEEIKQLEEWYEREDSSESKDVGLHTFEKSLSALQAQIDNALAQLTAVSKRIQEVAAENEILRREVIALRRQVSHLLNQPA